uniref:Keratin n=2 Tax=Gallus gallus TaxID=9031 RepID=A0A8V1A9J3_CHICK
MGNAGILIASLGKFLRRAEGNPCHCWVMATNQLACTNPCEAKCPQPLASSSNEPCVVTCGDSRVIIYPPPVVVTFPGPILTTYPQQTVVGSSESAEVAQAEPPAAAALPAEAPPVEKLTPQIITRPEPRCAPKYSYTYSSQWTHPCNSYRSGKRWAF